MRKEAAPSMSRSMWKRYIYLFYGHCMLIDIFEYGLLSICPGRKRMSCSTTPLSRRGLSLLYECYVNSIRILVRVLAEILQMRDLHVWHFVSSAWHAVGRSSYTGCCVCVYKTLQKTFDKQNVPIATSSNTNTNTDPKICICVYEWTMRNHLRRSIFANVMK